ncbi:conserved protein of unknown function [Magnetospirillum sp. XM-1]|uniref:bacteriophage abortive infection AbiH family protein n=1 Tax=Magnetospirillum sp. XM-1 TaxID=1663591 RepID=UPI00073DEB15|nr:bacteriophage abortive infection AbiH family protein [Magnetospirillum sp. XM-1]CUW37784.1 conserved protein of unknown function [Magnetospirillum sp. XM-1]
MNKLYVVGNGLDLYHGIPTSYKHFGVYLKCMAPEIFEIVDRYLGADDDLWCAFEARLADLDTDTMADDAGKFLVSYAVDEWSDAYHHDYQFEVNRIVSALSSKLYLNFENWLATLVMPSPQSLSIPKLPLPKDGRYLTFNYTETLQTTYGIPDEQVLHIHGQRSVKGSVILGHDWAPLPLNSHADLEEQDTRVTEGNEIIDSYFKKTFKPTSNIIDLNHTYFRSLQYVNEVVVLGHSMSKVDLPYFEEIIKVTNNPKWRISFFEKGDLFSKFDISDAIGISPNDRVFGSIVAVA